MKLFEYKGKEIFREYGIPVPDGSVAKDVQEAIGILQNLKHGAVVKAQILSGGRGKAGGVLFADTPEEMEKSVNSILGSKLKNLNVSSVLVEEKVNIQKELYLSITLNSETRDVLLVMSAEGGVEIESNADSIVTLSLGSCLNIQKYQIRNLLYKLQLPVVYTDQVLAIVEKIADIFRDYHATLVEINPLVITDDGRIIACDAKMNIDNNIIPYDEKVQDIIHSDPESYSSEYFKLENGFDYLELDESGAIGLLSTGAGLTMAVVDKLIAAGISPINFIDIRTGGFRGSTKRLEVALERILKSPNAKVILVNVFGGITDLNEFATLLLQALKKLNIKLPVVIRLEGNNFEMANETLKAAGMSAINSLDEAIDMAIELGVKA